MGNRLTTDETTSSDRIHYFGDPVSALDFNATTVMPSFKTRGNQSAHSYEGLEIADQIPEIPYKIPEMSDNIRNCR